MKNILLIIYKKSNLDKLDIRRSKNIYVVWTLFALGYIAIREIVGLHTIFIYIYLAIILFCRFSFMQISLIFFVIAICTYLLGQPVEANNYMSYVFIFFFLSLIKEYWIVFKYK